MKYTAIYVNNIMVGSHMQTTIHMNRIKQRKDESVVEMMNRLGIYGCTRFLFKGWPKLQGED